MGNQAFPVTNSIGHHQNISGQQGVQSLDGLEASGGMPMQSHFNLKALWIQDTPTSQRNFLIISGASLVTYIGTIGQSRG